MTGISRDEPDFQPPPRDPAPGADPDWGPGSAASPVPGLGGPASYGPSADGIFPPAEAPQPVEAPAEGPGPPADGPGLPGTPPEGFPVPQGGAAMPVRRAMWRPVSALLCFGAAILTLLGSFLDMFSTRLGGTNGNRIVLVVSSWSVRITNNGVPDTDTPPGLAAASGPPLIFAACVLLAAALLGLLAAAAPGSAAITRTGSLVAVGATAFLAGTTWAVTLEQLSLLDRFRPPQASAVPLRFEYEAAFELGFWLLIAANGAAIAGLVFALLPLGRGPRLRLRGRVEPDTPPLGFPALASPETGFPQEVIVHRLPDAPPDKPD